MSRDSTWSRLLGIACGEYVDMLHLYVLVDLSGNTCATCHMLTMKMEATHSSETSVSTYKNAVSQPEVHNLANLNFFRNYFDVL